MELLHKEFIKKDHINEIIKQAFLNNRKLYCRKRNAGSLSEEQISFVNISDSQLYFMCLHSAQLTINNNDTLIIHFSVRHENTFLPCEISVRVKKHRIFDHKLFFSTTFPVSIRHLQRRQFVRYPINPECFPKTEIAFTNTDCFLQNKWIPLLPETVTLGNISIGGLMFYLSTNNSRLQLSCRSHLIFSWAFNTPDQHTISPKTNTFHVIGEILDIQPIKNTKLKKIRSKFTFWTYQDQISWKKIHPQEGIEILAKFLFQYAYNNKIAAN